MMKAILFIVVLFLLVKGGTEILFDLFFGWRKK